MSLMQKVAVFSGPIYVDVYDGDGQSNKYGPGPSDPLGSAPYDTLGVDLLAPFDRVLIYNYDTDALEPLHVPINNMAANNANYVVSGPAAAFNAFGPELGFALAWQLDHPTGYLVIVKNSGNGQCIPYFASGTARDTLRLQRRAACVAAMAARGWVPKVRVYDWIQGECNMGNTQSAYQVPLEAKIASLYTDGTIDADTQILLAQIPTSSSNYGAGVAAAKVAIAATDPSHIKIVPYVDSRQLDNIHFDTYGMLRMGANLYAAGYNKTPIALPGD